MILPDFEIHRLCRSEQLVTPYNPTLVNPASLDLRLGNQFIDLHTGDEREAESITLRPGDAVLATTLEYVRIPVYCAGLLALKSSSARRGLDHALAGWIDPGFEGEITLELHAHREVTFNAGQPVIQIVLLRMLEAPREPYQGKYQKQRGPTPARQSKLSDVCECGKEAGHMGRCRGAKVIPPQLRNK